MIELKQYSPEDYLKIRRRDFDMLTFLNFPNPKVVARNLLRGMAITGFRDEEIVACGGIMPLWKGVGEAWVVTSPLVKMCSFSFVKVVWRRLLTFTKIMELERVQTTVDAEHEVSRKWVERMGFKQEGLLKKYINGRDFFRYALIKEK